MATAQNGTSVISTDVLNATTGLNGGVPDTSGEQVQRAKVGFGSDSFFRDVDASNGLPIELVNAGVVSTANSTTANLAIGGVFTGTAEDVSAYANITVGILANQVSATDGLSIQFSPDGTNWDYSDAYTISASASKTVSVSAHAKFFRIVYTNGGVATTVLRLHTMYHKMVQKSSSNRPTDNRSNEFDAEDVNAFGMAYDAVANLWQRLRSSTKGIQATNALATQDLKDSGRVNISMTSYQAAGIITTEALFAAGAFSISRDGATATTGVQLAVTAGKRLRIQSVEISVKNTAAAAGTSKLALRYLGAGGTITNASPILAIWDIGSNNATANNYIGPIALPLPDGVELLAGSSFGFTNLSSAITMLHTITVNANEY